MTPPSPSVWSRFRIGFGRLPRAWRLLRTAAPRSTRVALLLLVPLALVPALSALVSRQAVDGLLRDLREGGSATAISIGWAALVGLLWLVEDLLRRGRDVARSAQALALADSVAGQVQEACVRADLEVWERPEAYDRLHRARWEGASRPLALLSSAESVVQDVLTLATLALVLLPLGPWLPLALLVSAVPAIVVAWRSTISRRRLLIETTPIQRETYALDEILTARETAAQVRAFELGERIRARHADLRQRLSAADLAMTKRQAFAEALAGAFALAVAGVAIAFVVRRAFEDRISPGQVALCVQAFFQGQRLVRSALGQAAQALTSVMNLDALFELLDLQPKITAPTSPTPVPERPEGGIEVRGVSFRYGEGSRLALDGVTLDMPAGRVTAVLGANGAGKTTLLRLIARLADPEAGSITWDGVPLRAFDPVALRRRMSLLPIDPLRFDGTLAQNVALARPGGELSASERVRVARVAGLEPLLARLPEGWDTVLGPSFRGGTDLSTGEWQRVGWARVVLRETPVVLLDEPTRGLDVWAERAWIDSFRTWAAGRTVLVVTHSLAVAQTAACIHVMREGRIREAGAHAELVNAGGEYAKALVRGDADALGA